MFGVKHFGLVSGATELIMPLSKVLKPNRSFIHVNKPDPLHLVTTTINYVPALE